MNDILFKSILAMDSYNRGYDPAIKFGSSTEDYSIDTAGTQIGNATIIRNKAMQGSVANIHVFSNLC